MLEDPSSFRDLTPSTHTCLLCILGSHLECKLGGTHDFDDVEGSPADVVPKHL